MFGIPRQFLFLLTKSSISRHTYPSFLFKDAKSLGLYGDSKKRMIRDAIHLRENLRVEFSKRERFALSNDLLGRLFHQKVTSLRPQVGVSSPHRVP